MNVDDIREVKKKIEVMGSSTNSSLVLSSRVGAGFGKNNEWVMKRAREKPQSITRFSCNPSRMEKKPV